MAELRDALQKPFIYDSKDRELVNAWKQQHNLSVAAPLPTKDPAFRRFWSAKGRRWQHPLREDGLRRFQGWAKAWSAANPTCEITGKPLITDAVLKLITSSEALIAVGFLEGA